MAGRLAYEADRAAYVARGRTARKDRRVGLRPAPDTMSVLSGFLPVEQGVACLAALRKHTDAVVAAGDTRTRDQIMADTLVERVTGQARAADVNVEVGIVLPVDALLDPDAGGAADITGLRPDPRRDRPRRCWLTPGVDAGGGACSPPPLAWSAADPRRRCFDGVLAHLIRIRDGGRCRDPFCDAPIRHLDHIHPHRAAAPPAWPTGAECAPAATTFARCPAGGSSSSTTATVDIRTPSAPPRQPDTPTSAGQARLLGVFPIPRGDGEH